MDALFTVLQRTEILILIFVVITLIWLIKEQWSDPDNRICTFLVYSAHKFQSNPQKIETSIKKAKKLMPEKKYEWHEVDTNSFKIYPK